MKKTDMMNLKSLIQEALRLGMQYSAGDLDKKESELLKGKIENECAGIIAKNFRTARTGGSNRIQF